MPLHEAHPPVSFRKDQRRIVAPPCRQGFELQPRMVFGCAHEPKAEEFPAIGYSSNPPTNWANTPFLIKFRAFSISLPNARSAPRRGIRDRISECAVSRAFELLSGLRNSSPWAAARSSIAMTPWVLAFMR